MRAAAPDKTAPSVPAGIVESNLTATSFTVTWSPSTDNISVTGYEVFLGSTSQGTVVGTSKALSGLQTGTVYLVAVRARDAAGNWSAQSAPIAVTPLLDTTPPSQPTALSASQITSSGFTLTWNSSTDDVRVAAYEVFLGGVSHGTVATTTMSFTALAPQADYLVAVRALDSTGNSSLLTPLLTVTTLADTTEAIAAPAVVSGNIATAFVSREGKVYVWGYNEGAFGDGTTAAAFAPKYVPAWGAAKQIAATSHNVLALRADGTVWGAGDTSFGILGRTRASVVTTPVQIAGLSGIAVIAGGGYSAYALKGDGTLWSWGYNGYGQLGDGTLTDRTSPVQVRNLANVVAVSTGTCFVSALTSDGKVWVWGANLGTNGNTLTPALVGGLPVILSLAANGGAVLALDAAGQVWSWGSGTLGDGTMGVRSTPSLVPGLPPIRAIYGGMRSETFYAVAKDGTVYGWGRNDFGQTRPPASGYVMSPQQFTELGTVAAAAAGPTAGYAIQTDGRIRSWGGFTLDSIPGDGNASDPRLGDAAHPIGSAMAPLNMASGFAAIAIGGEHGLLRDKADNVWSFGANAMGQLGEGTTKDRFGPNPVPSLAGVTQIRAYGASSGAMRSDGRLWFWGDNGYANFGDGTTANRLSPVVLTSLSGVRDFDMSMHTLAVLSNGEVWGWGWNGYGQVGVPVTPTGVVATPQKVPGITNAIGVATSTSHSLALLSDGSVMEWGATTGASTPVAIRRLAGVRKVAAGESFSMALLQDGTVTAWGNNSHGELGDGSTSSSNRPIPVSGLAGITDISVRDRHSLALRNDGSVWMWGDGVTTPVRIDGIAGVRAISAGTSNGFIRADERAWLTGFPMVTSKATSLNKMLHLVADLRSARSADDTDDDGLPDTWEMSVFGTLSQNARDDFDGDGVTNGQEWVLGTNAGAIDSDNDEVPDWLDVHPNDYFDGVAPTLVIIDGNNQNSSPGTFNPKPFDVAVWSPDGTKPYVHAPVTFNVLAGGGLLSLATSGFPRQNSLSLFTDIDGTATVYYQQPPISDIVSKVSASAGASQVILTTSTAVDSDGDGLSDAMEDALGTNKYNPDTDGDGIPDGWEANHGLNPLLNDATADPDHDGLSNLDEFKWNLNPQISEFRNANSLTQFQYNLKDELVRFIPASGTAAAFTPDREGNIESIR